MSKYPECEKLHAVHEESQKIGNFLAWLKSNGYYLCKFYEREMLDEEGDQSDEGFYPDHKSIEIILAEYFEIDMDKVDEERRQILKELQDANN